jgi:hypothetical protein
MVLLELVSPRPDWTSALGKALERPPGVPERRRRPREETPEEAAAGRGRRLADDLAWLRQAVDEPAEHGIAEVPDTAAVAVWRPDPGDPAARLERLRARGVLDAAGFLLHDDAA